MTESEAKFRLYFGYKLLWAYVRAQPLAEGVVQYMEPGHVMRHASFDRFP